MSKPVEGHLLDAIPHPVIFADTKHIIRYMNKEAEHYLYDVRGYRELMGKCLLTAMAKISKK